MKELLKRFLNLNTLVKAVLIPLIVLIVYCLVFGFIFNRQFPESVNSVFVNRLGRYLLIPIGAVSILSIWLYWRRSSDKLMWDKKSESFTWTDLILILFPLTPVMQFILINRESLTFIDGVITIAAILFLSALVVIVIPISLQRFGNYLTIKSLGLVFIYTLTNMALLSKQYFWFGEGSLRIQIAYFAGYFIILRLLFSLRFKKIIHVFVIINFLSIIIVQSVQSVQFADGEPSSGDESTLLNALSGRKLVRKPNVYLLVYDSYVANETILSYGLDNSSQERYLQDQGFTLYPYTYSIAADTLGTMSRVLNASVDLPGHVRKAVSGNGVVQQIFGNDGYETYGVFPYDYIFQKIGSSYDHSFPPLNEKLSTNPLLKAIFMGEFRFNVGFDEISRSEFLEAKKELFTSKKDNPVFV